VSETQKKVRRSIRFIVFMSCKNLRKVLYFILKNDICIYGYFFFLERHSAVQKNVNGQTSFLISF